MSIGHFTGFSEAPQTKLKENVQKRTGGPLSTPLQGYNMD